MSEMTNDSDTGTPNHEEIRERLDAATPPSWELDKKGNVAGVAKVKNTADAELIVHAPDDLTGLLDENTDLTDDLADLRDENAELTSENADLTDELGQLAASNTFLRLVLSEAEEVSE